MGQMVRPQHMPPAQLRWALPAASCEGHVCTAGPGPCAGLLQGQVGGGRKESLALLGGTAGGRGEASILALASGRHIGTSGVCAAFLLPLKT